MAIQFEIFFFLIRRQNDECSVKNLRRFLFSMSPGADFTIFNAS